MVTLQDISVQLMKPAKDLADWKFPLSQILEEYYALLEPCNINFGEAALVLLNSTNVYVHRIERLFNETEVLRQAFLGYEEEETKMSASKAKKGLKKACFNFDNFVIIDLEKGVGRDIDKKNQFQGQTKIKLLSHRFTQLENNTMQLCIPIQVYDVLGEVIGKKYDFRCNQAVSTTGMLVDELTLHDFTHIVSSHVQKGRNSLSSYSEPKTPGTGTSGYHSAASPNHSLASVHENCENEHDFTMQIESNSSLNESENMLNNDNEAVNASISDTVVSNTERNLSKEQDTRSNEVENSNDKHCAVMNSNDTNESREKYQSDSPERVENNETNDVVTNNKQRGRPRKDQVVQLNNAQGKEELHNTRKRGNQATKKSIHSVDDINELDWRPMPLVQGMKKVFSRDTSVLKLPEHISLLKTDSKKRKLPSKISKSECLAKLVLRETELRVKKDIVTQTKPRFKRLQKQELEDFMRNFDQCFNGTEKENNNAQPTAVTNFTLNLMGCNSQNENDFIENNDEEITSRSSSPSNTKSQSATRQESLKMMEKSPDLHDSWCESLGSEINLSYSLPDYQNLIEDKMKEICEEADISSELDQTVAAWHASLQPKLLEAETRPTFRIHDYASRIISTLQTVEQNKINFDNIVEDKPAYEVARYFLASLQLANSYNVEIKTESNGKSIEIELLNDEKRYEKN